MGKDKYICDICKHVYYVEKIFACPVCGSVRTYNINLHLEMVMRHSILAESFRQNTPEEKEDIIQFVSELYYPIKQKKN